VYAATEFAKEANEMTMRDALEWYKSVIRVLRGMTRDLEAKYLNERWVALCDAIGKREGVPTGALSYFLGELAQAEAALPQVADHELSNG